MEEERVRSLINALYQGAGIDKRFSGTINEQVAEVLGDMLGEISKCSDALVWVPHPSGGKASISWFARNFARSTVSKLRDSTSLTCARGVIYKWDRKLQMAGMGF